MAKKIDVALTVKENPLGQGNTQGGSYDYKFDPDNVHVTEADTEIVYRLVEEDWERFAIEHIYTTDVIDQISKPTRSDDKTQISVVHKNTRRMLTVVSVRVSDRKKGCDLGCDPQVTNDPPPVSGGG
jgi:hypothetical protein